MLVENITLEFGWLELLDAELR